MSAFLLVLHIFIVHIHSLSTFMKNRIYSFSICAAVLMSSRSEQSGAKNWKKSLYLLAKKLYDG